MISDGLRRRLSKAPGCEDCAGGIMHLPRFRKITRRNLLRSGLMSLAGLNLSDRFFAKSSRPFDANQDEFLNPADSARPWVYWYFMDGNLTADGMAADLEAMKRAGIGGGVYLEVGIGIAPGPVQFMSEAWQQLVAQAFSRADDLGIEIALAAGAGWCGAGGPWIKPEESMQFLSTSETRITGPARFDAQLPRPESRTPFFGEDTLTPELRTEWSDFYVDEFVLAFPAPAGDARIADIDEKALYTRGSYSSQILGPFTTRPWVRPFLPASAAWPSVPSRDCIAPGAVQNLTRRMKPDGRLDWDVPAGDWIIVRAGRTITGQTTRPAPKPGLGLESDKFSREAIDHHFDAYFRKLLERIGPRRHANSGLTTVHYDSWEMSSQNWTARFQSEFEQRRGYDPAPFLPAFRGYVVDNEQTTERFLWDIRQTAQELVIENQATRLRELGHRNGLQLALEPYDLNPCSDLELGAVADVPMAEFWSRFGDINTDWSVVESTSVAHTNGRRIVAAEAFTAEQADHWLQHPASMKNQGDWAFCAGINRIVFHRFQSQPWNDRYPGMTMGPDGGYGVHWDRTQTWWDMVPAYHLYISRCQTMLRRGLFVADVLYLAAEGAPNVFLPPPSVFLSGDMPDRRGYNFDGCGPETLIGRASVRDGNIVFPDGMMYRLLVLPQVETMTPRLLKKIAELVQNGASIIGMAPKASPSLTGYPQCDESVKTLAATLWGDGPQPPLRNVGKGTVWHDDSATRLRAQNPLAAARWIWSSDSDRAKPGEDRVYFSHPFDVESPQEVDSAGLALTAHSRFEVSVNGKLVGSGHDYTKVRRFDVTSLLVSGRNEITVTVSCEPEEKTVPCGLIGALAITRSGQSKLIATGASWRTSAAPDGPSTQAVDRGTFDVAPWKLTPASLEEASLYPSYRITARVLAQRGILPDFDGAESIRYIHRRDGDEDIYFLGNREDRLQSTTVRFRLTGKHPEWWDPITGERRELSEFEEKVGHTLVPIRLEAFESGFVVFRRNGSSAQSKGKNFPEAKTIKLIQGPWEVSFDRKWGGPAARTVFAQLEDWSQRAEPEIKYYSGKAIYRASFDCPDADRGGMFHLALGRVCNIATAQLNGREMGTAWCHPWRLRIPPGLLQEKANKLEIVVANLWVNRLIRDSGLPAEERLTWVSGNPLHADSPLRPSGLLGPVTIESTIL
ncbi:MAG TPA: glycosyl hydrolase [Terracidiphilus sp.]